MVDQILYEKEIIIDGKRILERAKKSNINGMKIIERHPIKTELEEKEFEKRTHEMMRDIYSGASDDIKEKLREQ